MAGARDMSDINALARDEINRLRTGELPNGHVPSDFGPWFNVVAELHQAAQTGGKKQVEATVVALVNADLKCGGRGIARLLAGNNAPAVIRPTSGAIMPPLPDYATDIYKHQKPCAKWLDDYIAFASEAAPMTPRSFHETSGLFAGSVAIARRLVAYFGTRATYPNLFLLQIAPSTLYKKTTGMDILSKMFELAGTDHLMLPQTMTPQGISEEFSIKLTNHIENYATQSEIDEWLIERAFAAQRGWMLDEAAGFFESFKREFNSGLHMLILRLYECPDHIRDQTVSRGRVTMRKVYLSFLGATTPVTMTEHLNNRQFWTGGLWPRFAFITPDTTPVFVEQPEERRIPSAIVRGFRHIYDLFPRPVAHLDESDDDDNGGKRKHRPPVVVIDGDEEPSRVVMEPGVKDAHTTYQKATEHTLLLSGEVDTMLHSAYGRLASHAFKVAMILATMDTERLPVRIELHHFARAQHIVETWRSSLHRMWDQGAAREDAIQTDRILELLTKARGASMTARDIYRTLHLGAGEGRALLEELALSGQVERSKTTAGNGRQIELWRSVTSVTTVSQTKVTPFTATQSQEGEVSQVSR